jgi:phage shock protein A
MEFLKSRMECDPHEDPRKVLIVAMKDMRAAMEELRDELDSLDSTGKYR